MSAAEDARSCKTSISFMVYASQAHPVVHKKYYTYQSTEIAIKSVLRP